MREQFLEILTLIVAAGGLSIAFITLKHRFKKDEQERHQKQIDELLLHTTWKKNIEFDIEKIKFDTEEIRTSRQKNLSEIWKAIQSVREDHDNDIKEANRQFEDVLKEIRTKNEELIKMLTIINNTVIKLEAQFTDHKEEHKSKR